MLIQQIRGNINTNHSSNKTIDWLQLHWYETNKRILIRKTTSGEEISFKFLDRAPLLTQGDILFEDEINIIAVEVLPCDCIVIKPKNMFDMASVCYEIGNKHLPLFFENDEVLVPFEKPLFSLLTAQGYEVEKAERKLLAPLKTTVSPHPPQVSSTLFSKIMKLTTND